jgi:hypothetical protein
LSGVSELFSVFGGGFATAETRKAVAKAGNSSKKIKLQNMIRSLLLSSFLMTSVTFLVRI